MPSVSKLSFPLDAGGTGRGRLRCASVRLQIRGLPRPCRSGVAACGGRPPGRRPPSRPRAPRSPRAPRTRPCTTGCGRQACGQGPPSPPTPVRVRAVLPTLSVQPDPGCQGDSCEEMVNQASQPQLCVIDCVTDASCTNQFALASPYLGATCRSRQSETCCGKINQSTRFEVIRWYGLGDGGPHADWAGCNSFNLRFGDRLELLHLMRRATSDILMDADSTSRR